MKTDTIAAIATGCFQFRDRDYPDQRRRGPECGRPDFPPEKGDRKVSDMESHTVHYGYVTDGEEVIG